MAGDWIKMRSNIVEDPAVIGIASALGIDEFSVVGRLHLLWAWADSQSRDGHASSVTEKWIDRKVQFAGFAAAMVSAGWLTIEAGGVEFPNFDRHNGETAKQRGLAANRKSKQRENVTEEVTQESRNERDKTVTREEKRREEKEPELLPAVASQPPVYSLPLVGGVEFGITKAVADEFAAAYPSVDIPANMRRMRVWLIANPKKRPTKSGGLRFANIWLAKEQDNAPRNNHANRTQGRSLSAAERVAAVNDAAERRDDLVGECRRID